MTSIIIVFICTPECSQSPANEQFCIGGVATIGRAIYDDIFDVAVVATEG